jgi:DNA repair protein RecO (recombination protein O)
LDDEGTVPLKTSEAFVIDVRKLQEADRLVVLFTEDEGKISGVAKSAARSRRRFGGKLERLSRVRATWFDKEGRELCRVDSFDLLEESFSLHQDLRRAALLPYIAEMVDTFGREREADPRYYRLLRSVIAALREGGDPRTLARYFEVWTLRLHGLLPDMDRCASCGRDLAASGGSLVLGDTPAVFCRACRGAVAEHDPGGWGGASIRLAPEAVGLVGRFRTTAPAALGAPPGESALSAIGGAMERMMTGFVGHPFRSRRFLRDVEGA